MTGRAAAREGVRAWLLDRTVRQWILAAGAVVLLVSGLFGGLRKAEADGLDTIEVGRTLHVEPLDLTIERARWTTDLGDAIGESEVGRYLVVFAKVRSTSDTTVGGFVIGEALRLDGIDGLAKEQFSDERVSGVDAEPRVLVADDAVALGNLNPGLTYDVAFVWEQETSQPLPDTLDLVAYSHRFRQSSLDDQEDWFDRSKAAVGSLAVQESTS